MSLSIELPGDVLYHPRYCEENIWHLCQHPELAHLESHVVFISNASRRCLFFHQRAAGDQPFIVWDYHVVLLVKGEETDLLVYDLDTVLPSPMPATSYLQQTFPDLVPDELAPLFRLVTRAAFIAAFATDRSHMRQDDGSWLAPPPPWPPPAAEGHTMNLMSFVDMEGGIGEVLDLEQLLLSAGAIWKDGSRL